MNARKALSIAKAGLRSSLITNSTNPNYRKYTPFFRETFGDLNRWVSTGYGVNTDDIVNYAIAGADRRETGAWVLTTGHAFKLTKTITSVVVAKALNTFAAATDFTGKHGLLRYYVHEGSGVSSYQNLHSIYVQFIDASGIVATWIDFGNSAATPAFKPGWRTFPLSWGKFASVGGGFDFTQVKKIQLSINTKPTMEAMLPAVTFDLLEFFPKVDSPIPYVVTFDGGYTGQKEALAYLASRGVRAHIYVTYDRIGDSSHMTLDDLKQAQFMGHTIDVHERETLPTGWFTMTQGEKQASLEEALNWKLRNGFSGKGFAPLGAQWYDDDDTLNTMEPYLEHIRLSGLAVPCPWNPRVVGVSYDTNNLTVAGEATARQVAITNGYFYVGLVHSLLGTFTLANFKTIIEAAITDTGVRFVTIPELIETNWYG